MSLPLIKATILPLYNSVMSGDELVLINDVFASDLGKDLNGFILPLCY